MTLSAIALSPEPDSDHLLVLLHGWGANAQDVAGLIEAINMIAIPFRGLLPNAPFDHPMVPGGKQWYSFPPNYDFRMPHDFEAQADLARKTPNQLLSNRTALCILAFS